jgi:tetratricopeptide (TPR) repeat protein
LATPALVPERGRVASVLSPLGCSGSSTQERRLAPTNAKARYNLANVLHDLKEYAAARLLFRDAVALAGQMADAHFYLALTCEKLELVDEATGHWGSTLRWSPRARGPRSRANTFRTARRYSGRPLVVLCLRSSGNGVLEA